MQRKTITRWVLILGVGAGLTGVFFVWPQVCLPRPVQDSVLVALPDNVLNPFPDSVLVALSLQKSEAPPAYGLITSTNLLARAGILKNPDYLTRRADLEAAVLMDCAAEFLALYGSGESVRLMVKGVFFREPEQAVKYAEVQNTRQRLVMAYRRETLGGIWLLFVACDPDLMYDETELRSITEGLRRYQRRLTLSPLFDQINIGEGE